jgi:hypothetical protein
MKNTHFLKRSERESGEETERNRLSEAHSRPGDGRERDLSGHGKKTDRARPTHSLETAEGGTCQDTGKKPTEQGPLTPWRWQREGLVRARRVTDRARPTHSLEMAEGETYQDTERNRPSKAYSHPGDRRGSELSGNGKKHTERGRLTSWRQEREGLVRTRKETDQARPTHQLDTAERGTCQDAERNRPSGAHSLSSDSRGTDFLGQKETDRAKPTYSLETVGRDLSEHGKSRPSKAYSPAGDRRRRDLSGNRKQPTERGPLTNWRRQREGEVRTRKETERARPTYQLETAE